MFKKPEEVFLYIFIKSKKSAKNLYSFFYTFLWSLQEVQKTSVFLYIYIKSKKKDFEDFLRRDKPRAKSHLVNKWTTSMVTRLNG